MVVPPTCDSIFETSTMLNLLPGLLKDRISPFVSKHVYTSCGGCIGGELGGGDKLPKVASRTLLKKPSVAFLASEHAWFNLFALSFLK